MPEIDVFDSVKAANLAAVEELIKSGASVNQVDKHGWTPLNWAAAKGNLRMVELLVERGADVFKVGTDQRTASMIALAAGHAEVFRFLRQIEDRIPGDKPVYPERKYCKAYHLKQFRQFPGWTEKRLEVKLETGAESKAPMNQEQAALSGDTIVYLHQDYRVTRSMWNDEDVIFNQVTPDWKHFCTTVVGFKVPDDLDLIVPSVQGQQTPARVS